MGLEAGSVSSDQRPLRFCLALAVGVSLIGLPAIATAAAGQVADEGWQVESALLVADMTRGDGGADVTARFTLRAGDGRGAKEPIQIELLGFGEATARVVSLEDGSALVLWPTVGTHRAASVHAPDTEWGEALTLEFRYRVERATEFEDGTVRVRIPVLNGPSAPTSAEEDGFEARLLLPDGWSPTEAFPTGLKRLPDGDYAVSLPVVPSMVGFRAGTDGAWRPGVPMLMDLLTISILAAFAAFGWRHLRAVARAARA